ncbi:MAG TPA: hypothetical protein ENK31_10005 [Nannocystis exedens]|nr:hypothetical protein [Nannocystis exedens]
MLVVISEVPVVSLPSVALEVEPELLSPLPPLQAGMSRRTERNETEERKEEGKEEGKEAGERGEVGVKNRRVMSTPVPAEFVCPTVIFGTFGALSPRVRQRPVDRQL